MKAGVEPGKHSKTKAHPKKNNPVAKSVCGWNSGLAVGIQQEARGYARRLVMAARTKTREGKQRGATNTIAQRGGIPVLPSLEWPGVAPGKPRCRICRTITCLTLANMQNSAHDDTLVCSNNNNCACSGACWSRLCQSDKPCPAAAGVGIRASAFVIGSASQRDLHWWVCGLPERALGHRCLRYRSCCGPGSCGEHRRYVRGERRSAWP